MEYGNDFKSNYTTLQISTTLDWKKMNEKKKNDTNTNSPQGGWGMGSKEPIQNYFYYQWLQYHKTDMIPLDSYTKWNQELTKCKN